MPLERPDGRWSWVVLVAAVILRIILNGLWSSPGVLLVALLQEFGGSTGDTAWISSIFVGISYLACPVAGLLVRRFGARRVALASGIITPVGLGLCFLATSIIHLYFTYGIITGIGVGLAYICCNEALKDYFLKNRNFSLGLAAGLSGLGNVAGPPLIQLLIHEFGLHRMFLLMAAISAHILPCGLLFRPIHLSTEVSQQKALQEARKAMQCKTWIFLQMMDFYLLTVNCLLYNFGSAIVMHYLSAHAISQGVANKTTAAYVYAVLGATLIVAKILQGVLANIKRVRMRCLYLFCYILGGAVTLLLLLPLPLPAFFVYAVLFGFSYAAFGGALIPALIIQMAGDSLFSFAYGLIIFSSAFGQFLGPPVAGLIYDYSKSYQPPFILGSLCMVASGCIMFVTCKDQAANVRARYQSVEIDVKEKLMNGHTDAMLTQHVSTV